MRSRFSLTFALARKDWRLFWADRRAAILCFVVPVLLAAAFGAIFHKPASAGGPKLPLLVVVEDGGAFARLAANDLLSSPRCDAREVSRAEANELVANKRAVAVVLPVGFDKLKDWEPGAGGSRPDVRILHHPSATTERQWAEGVVTDSVMRRTAREAFGAKESEVAPPFRVQADAVSAHPGAFDSYTHSFCGMTLQYLLFWGMESGLLLLRERQRPVWLRARAAAVPIGCVVCGKALATGAVAVLQVLVTFAVGYLAFGVKVHGSFAGFALLACAACALAAATGLLVAALGGTEARARNVSILFILGACMLGGLWVPAFLLPDWARSVQDALPTAWAMRGLEAVTWQRGGFWSAVPGALAVGGFAAALLALAAVRLKLAERAARNGGNA